MAASSSNYDAVPSSNEAGPSDNALWDLIRACHEGKVYLQLLLPFSNSRKHFETCVP